MDAVIDHHRMYPNALTLCQAIEQGCFDGDYGVLDQHTFHVFRPSGAPDDILSTVRATGPRTLELHSAWIGVDVCVAWGNAPRRILESWFHELQPGATFHVGRHVPGGTVIERVACTVQAVQQWGDAADPRKVWASVVVDPQPVAVPPGQNIRAD